MKANFYLLGYLLLWQFSYAQETTSRIRGFVYDAESGDPNGFISVDLFNSDSVLVQSTQTDTNGYFSFISNAPNSYYLQVELSGYKKAQVAVNDLQPNKIRTASIFVNPIQQKPQIASETPITIAPEDINRMPIIEFPGCGEKKHKFRRKKRRRERS